MMRWFNWLCVSLAISVAGCQCKKEPPKPTLKNEGEACQSDDQCKTGLCDGVPLVGSPTCVRKCASGCAMGEVCIQFTENRFACQPDKRLLCQNCSADTDCAYPSDKCLAVNGEQVCGRDCAFDQNCPEGYRCVNGLGVDGTAKVQQCVPINASCACLARGDFLQPCTVQNQFGTCSGIKQCDLVNNVVACDAPTPESDVCNGKDDNCDGVIDEDGGTVTCGVGACQRTVAACSMGGAVTCTPADGGPELCDAIDNDCDGMTDEDFPVQADPLNCGACGKVCMLPHATPKCETAICKVDTCDTGWDNCNNMDPDGCEAMLSSDPNNCGMCGRVCSSANSVPSCVGGNCQFVCAAGFIDLDLDPSNGCEYACTFMSATDLPDLGFVDANCDGIDGELTNGIFVSPNGVDTNSGLTRAAPKRSLNSAVVALATSGKRDLYVAAGTYDEPLELLGISGVNAAGQYDPATWRRAMTNTTTVRTGNPALKLDAVNNVLVQGFRFEGGAGAGSTPSAYGAWVSESQGVKLEGLFVQAGRGADGAPGVGGGVGTTGGTGGTGAAGCVAETRPFSGSIDAQLICAILEGDCNRPNAGTGGTSACGYPGGPGGQPSHFDFDIMPVPAGQSGNPAPNGTGTGGTGVPHLTTPQPGSQYYGLDGASGAVGSNGAGATTSVMFGANGYVLRNGSNGAIGGHGRGGGGGGGGAGGQEPIIHPSLASCEAFGSGGGGGGGGGCGGGFGFGGIGGGASIALFLYNSNVTATAVNARSGNGGNGGAGGDGGGGGPGGPGGGSNTSGDQGDATRGGGGGKGGDGGRGGHGGGGAGGSVYGLVKNGATTWSPGTGVSFMLGTGGSAGSSMGNAGPAGSAQLQLTF